MQSWRLGIAVFDLPEKYKHVSNDAARRNHRDWMQCKYSNYATGGGMAQNREIRRESVMTSKRMPWTSRGWGEIRTVLYVT